MLRTLHIENYALIEELDITFESGFSVIAGETGGGKSILLGAIGVPVFSGFSGGFGIITGATGGFIIGYLFAAVLVGLLSSGTDAMSAKKAMVRLALACLTGMVCCYAFGLAWFMVLTGTDLMGSLVACVFPFLPGDAVKIGLAVILIRRLKPVVNRQQ